jgi:hypothetical protein
MSDFERKPTVDELTGMRWWNALTLAQRQYWMREAGNTGIVADAWEAYKKHFDTERQGECKWTTKLATQ